MADSTSKKCLVQIDALFDTRLGTLNILEPEQVIALSPAWYVSRTCDDFTRLGVDTELFTAAYRMRDKVTLMNSILTNIIPVIQNCIHQYIALVNPIRRGPLELDLNFYPYRLNTEEKDTFALLLEHKLGGIIKVNPVVIPYVSMTLGSLYKQYHTVFIYDWVEWAMVNEQSFRTEAAPNLTVVAPDLLQGLPIDGNLDEATKAAFAITHPTTYMEVALAPAVGMSFEPVSSFSFIH